VFALHGRAGHALEWLGLAASLGDRHVAAPDLRGHGESGWTPDYLIDSMVEDAVATLDEMAVGPVDVVGHSLGGLVAIVLASTHPDRVRRLVIADIGPRLPRGSREVTEMSSTGPFPTFDDAVATLRSRNQVAPHDVLVVRAHHGIVERADGLWAWRHDPAVDHLSGDPAFEHLWSTGRRSARRRVSSGAGTAVCSIRRWLRRWSGGDATSS
jgi:pimeloyl-ACP methyl ester carboxylesterase